ncbi:MAG TPA: hypothetical protein VK832_15190 [Burkholderiaceae bacterium]|nr:hypothetical protein [Burkholderiaceae bacterium]
MPLFVAHFLVMEENIWFADVAPYTAIQRTESDCVQSEIFLASDAEEAYARAVEMIDDFSEANYDGPGDITNYSCRGLYQLREISVDDGAQSDSAGLLEIDIECTPPEELPLAIPAKEELKVFAVKRN